MSEKLNRRDFLKLSALAAAGVAATACVAQTTTAPTAAPTKAPPTATPKPAATKAAEPTKPPEPTGPSTKQAPELVDMVKAGTIPPLDERIPQEPLVIEPIEEIGTYGGAWRQLHRGANDRWQNSYIMFQRIGKYSYDFTELKPNLAKGWEFNSDGTACTIYFRKGIKWDDGEDLTVDDVVFWWDEVVLNDDLTPNKPGTYKRGGELADFEKVDDYSFKFTFAQPYGAFENYLIGQMWDLPAEHFMRNFHAAWADTAELEAAIKEADVDTWTDLWGVKTMVLNDPGTPRFMAWSVTNLLDQPLQIFERNIYFWKTDTEGNQLPYLDEVSRTLVADAQAMQLKALAGEFEYQARGVAGLANRPVNMENREGGDYRLIPTLSPGTNWGTLYLNYSHSDPVLKELFMNLKFRIALSVAWNRKEMTELLDKGLTTPSASTCSSGTPWWKPEFRDAYIEYDPDQAKELLDEIGLDQKDSEGFRLRSDGKRLSLVLSVFGTGAAVIEKAEMYKGYWEDVGIECVVKGLDRPLWVEHVRGCEHDLAMYANNLGFWGVPPIDRTEAFVRNQHYTAPKWALYFDSAGAEGEAPPEDVQKIHDMYEEIKGETSAQKRDEMQTEVMALHAKNIWCIGYAEEAQAARYALVKNHFRNVPEVAHQMDTLHPSTFFIKE